MKSVPLEKNKSPCKGICVLDKERVKCIGCGRTIDEIISDIRIVENELCRVHPCVEDLDSVRQLILMDMAYNMGVPRLCKFKNMWGAIHDGNYEIASIEMMDSRWAKQVGSRAVKLSDAMRAGEF